MHVHKGHVYMICMHMCVCVHKYACVCVICMCAYVYIAEVGAGRRVSFYPSTEI